MKKRNYIRKAIPLIGCFCILVLVMSGCAPLRKKFTRQKKKDKDAELGFVPVLEPVDYPVKSYSSEDRYKKHYSLWQVWSRDLIQTVEDESSDKRQIFLLNKTISELEEMQQYLTEAKQAELTTLTADLKAVLKMYDKPNVMRNKTRIKKKLERNAKAIRNSFSPKLSLTYR